MHRIFILFFRRMRVPLLVLIVLTLLRFSMQPLNVPRFTRQSASLVLVVLGMIAMAAQLTLLYSYQAHIGFVFSRIALLNSLFMAGLALGAGFIGQRLVRSGQSAYALIAVMVSTTVLLATLPSLYHYMGDMGLGIQQPLYLSLTVLIGLLCYSIFSRRGPLGGLEDVDIAALPTDLFQVAEGLFLDGGEATFDVALGWLAV